MGKQRVARVKRADDLAGIASSPVLASPWTPVGGSDRLAGLGLGTTTVALPSGGVVACLTSDPGALSGAAPTAKPTAVVLHGYGETASVRSWGWAYRVLAKAGLAVVGIDMPGFGASPGERSAARSEHVAVAGGPVDVVVAVANALGLARPLVVLGYDWGAAIGLGLAASRPWRVARLFLMNPMVTDPAGYARVSVPSTVVSVSGDVFHPVAMAKRLVATLPCATHVVISAGGYSAAKARGNYACIRSKVSPALVGLLDGLRPSTATSTISSSSSSYDTPGPSLRPRLALRPRAQEPEPDVPSVGQDEPDVPSVGQDEPDVEPDVQVLVEPDVEPDVQVLVEPDVKPDVQVLVEPDVKPDVQVLVEPDVEPDVQVLVEPDVEPVVQVQVEQESDGAVAVLLGWVEDGSLKRRLGAVAKGAGSAVPPATRRETLAVLHKLPVVSPAHLVDPEELVAWGLWPSVPPGWRDMAASSRYPVGRRVSWADPHIRPDAVPAEDYLAWNPDGAGRAAFLTTRAEIVGASEDGDVVLAIDQVGGGVHTVVVCPRQLGRLNQRDVYKRAAGKRKTHTLVFEDNIKADYASPLMRGHMCGILASLRQVSTRLDWSPGADGGRTRAAQLEAVRAVAAWLDMTRLQDGVDRSRNTSHSVGKLIAGGQGHCHGLTSAMAAVLAPVSHVLGIDVMYRRGEVLSRSDDAPVVTNRVDQHHWLELALRPNMELVTCDLSWAASQRAPFRSADGLDEHTLPVSLAYSAQGRKYPHAVRPCGITPHPLENTAPLPGARLLRRQRKQRRQRRKQRRKQRG